MKPLISIIMNCFNGEEYLQEAINSIIKQTYINWELIFWDNKSTDSSAEIIAEYNDKRIKYYLSNEHSALGLGRVKAIEKAKGNLIAFLDVDDIWMKNKLEEIVNSYSKNKEAGIFYSNTIFFNDEYKMPLYRSKQKSGKLTSLLLTNYFLSLESVVINKEKLDLLDIKFDQRFNHISDFDLFTRLSSLADIVYVPKILCGWRVHDQSESFKRQYLFYEEKLNWHSINANNILFKDFQDELNEFKLITEAEKRFYSNNPFNLTRID